MTPGHCIVVGGHSRGVGKTALVVCLVRALGDARGLHRVVTVKVSAHRHGRDEDLLIEEDHVESSTTSTGRCLQSGAQRAFLVRCPDERLPEAASFVRELVRDGWHVVVESNRISGLVAADATLFVVSSAIADWKASSDACLSRADAVVLAPDTSVPTRVAPFTRAHGGRAVVLQFDGHYRVPALATWLDTVDENGFEEPRASACAVSGDGVDS